MIQHPHIINGNDTQLPTELIHAYLNTDYRVFAAKPFHLNIGKPSTDLLQLYQQHQHHSALFITAYNPLGNSQSDEENQQRNQMLREWIIENTWVHYNGEGQSTDSDWPAEQSFLILGVSQENAERLGRQYQQNALVFVGMDGIPKLLMLE